MKKFNELTLKALESSEKKRYYVYALSDPKDDTVFYIGKGTQNRVFSHERDAREIEGNESEKIKKIREIQNRKDPNQNQVKREIISSCLTEKEAFIAESVLIEALKHFSKTDLKNIVSGHDATDIMSVETFDAVFGADEVDISDIKEKILLISIGTSYKYSLNDKETYEQARGYWGVNVKRANKADYVFAVYHGLVVGIYNNITWHNAEERNGMPVSLGKTTNEIERDVASNKKWFSGDIVSFDSDIAKKYYHKAISNLPRSYGATLRYINF